MEAGCLFFVFFFFSIHICFALICFCFYLWTGWQLSVWFFLFAHLPAVLYILGALYTVSLFFCWLGNWAGLGWGLWDWSGVGTGMGIGIGKAGRTIMGRRFGPLIDNTLEARWRVGWLISLFDSSHQNTLAWGVGKLRLLCFYIGLVVFHALERYWVLGLWYY